MTYVLQSEKRSTTDVTLGRVKYLIDTLGNEYLDSLVRTYFHNNRGGKDVTLSCLAAIGESRLHEIADSFNRDMDTAKKEFGLLVPIVLARLFGDDKVYTYRDANNNNVTIPVPPELGIDWVGNYTQHMVDFTS